MHHVRPQSGATTARIDWSADLAPSFADPEPLRHPVRRLSRFIGPAISIAVLVAVLLQFRQLDWGHIRSIVPTSPLFWGVFAAAYLTAPFADWIIFRRLCGIPISGFGALLRKLIGNEIVLGYIGELYFYNWARQRTDLTGSPFGAVKDVTILSALVGNLVTLVMLAFVWPWFGALHLGLESKVVVLSVATVIATSLAAMAFRRRLFTLPRRELRFVLGMHLIRIVTTTGLAAVTWALVLPGVVLSWWLLLATIRLLLSRLPFLPNKDLVFAGVAIFLVGHDQQIAALLAMIASLILATHVVLGAMLVSADFAWGRMTAK